MSERSELLPPVIVSVTNSLCKHLQVSAPSMQTMWVCKLVSLIKHHHFFKAIRDCPQKSSCTRDKARVKLTGVLHNRTSQTISCLDYRICRPLVLNIDIWYHSCRPLVQICWKICSLRARHGPLVQTTRAEFGIFHAVGFL